MTKRTIAAELAAWVIAIDNCERNGNNEWAIKHADAIEEMVKNHLPRSSGFDSGTQFDIEENEKHRGSRLIFETAFHHMNDGGYYDGWTEHKVTVYPLFCGSLDVRVSGQNRNDIKDYIGETFHHILTSEAPST